jgi:hypothetical protein
MAEKPAAYDFQKITASLPEDQRSLAEELHQFTLSLGYLPKAVPQGKGSGGWKCEYKKGGRVLAILRVLGETWSLCCKLYHLPEYGELLEQCGAHCVETLLANVKGCGHHRGSCAGPLDFQAGGKSYSPCRHSLVWTGLIPEDVAGIKLLLGREAAFPR